MGMARFLACYLAIASSGFGAGPVFQDSNLYPGQSRYRVGFREMNLNDGTRPFGKRESRMVHLFLWYPAASGPGQPMHLENYADLYQGGEQSDGVLSLHEWAARMRIDQSRIEPILALTGTAHGEADPLPGRFPLILYAAGFRGPSYESFAMCEHLAGQGFVVVAIPSVGKDATGMTMDKMGIECQLRDLEMAHAYAVALPFVDQARIGTMGFSLGAVAAALLAIRNPDIRICVSIDGGMQYTYALLGGSLDKADAKLNGAYLQLTQRPTPSIRLDNRFYDTHAVSNAYHFQWKRLDHYDFASLTLLLKSARPKDYKPSQQEIELNGVNETPYNARFEMYRLMTRIVYLFSDAHLRDSSESQKELRRLIESKLPEQDDMFSIRTMK